MGRVEEISYPLPVIRQVADAIREDDGGITVILIRELHRYHVIGGRIWQYYCKTVWNSGLTLVRLRLQYSLLISPCLK